MKLMQVNKTAAVVILKAAGFLRRQQRDWKITVARTSLRTFVYKMVFPYQSIYIVGLGATATQLGIVNTAGMGVAGLLSPLAGWLIDRIGNKTIYLIGIGLLAISYLTYGVAQSWTIIIVAMVAYWLGNTTSIHSCATVCANSLTNEDRATGMSFCETLAAGLLAMAAPMVGALLVAAFGGVNVEGIRPLFFVSLLVTGGTFFLILTQLSNRRWRSQNERRPNLFGDLSQVFKQGRNLKRWLVIASVGWLPMGMVLPFIQVFAHEIKGANQYILGAMVTGSALTPLVLGIPLGRLADKIGRKKVLYLIAPLFWASNLILIWAPNPGFLIVAGILQGFFLICLTIAGAMGVELVPAEQMGRWLGVMRFFRLLLASGVAYLAGVIWDRIGPEYVFLIAIGLDILIRMPLLIGMPETLGLRIGEEQVSKGENTSLKYQ
jgi:MFS family permease